MARNTKYRIERKNAPQAIAPELVHDPKEEFGNRLYQALIEADMSQSDLAREVFNETRTDPKTGYELVVGRDRISQYVRGKQFPEPRVFKRICAVLGKKQEELAPKMVGTTIQRENPSIEMTVVGDRHDLALLRINKVMPLRTATKIIDMIDDD